MTKAKTKKNPKKTRRDQYMTKEKTEKNGGARSTLDRYSCASAQKSRLIRGGKKSF